MATEVTIDELKSSGLVTDEQIKNMTPEQKKLIEKLTKDELAVLQGIKRKAGSIGTLTDGNIIF